jgi:hypothetical protein
MRECINLFDHFRRAHADHAAVFFAAVAVYVIPQICASRVLGWKQHGHTQRRKVVINRIASAKKARAIAEVIAFRHLD